MVGLTREQRLERDIGRTESAAAVIDRDPEQARDVLAPLVKAAPNVGEITAADMLGLFTQMQAQMGAMQEQMVLLMTGQTSGGKNVERPDNAAELAKDKEQRDLTLKAWNEEPRRPVFVHPDPDEDKIMTVMGTYPPRLFRINGLEFPIKVGEIIEVPMSVASLVEYTQRKRPYSGPPQGLGQIGDPQRGQFLAGSQSITIGNAGRSGEGHLTPEGLPPPQPLGIRYDHNGQ